MKSSPYWNKSLIPSIPLGGERRPSGLVCELAGEFLLGGLSSCDMRGSIVMDASSGDIGALIRESS